MQMRCQCSMNKVFYKECVLYEEKKDKSVTCNVCSHRCKIQEEKKGICGVRKNISGKLYSLVYGLIAASAIDPIEKKPLYHFLPGTSAYSIGTVGCNFRCDFCQNNELAFSEDVFGDEMLPNQIVENAIYYGCESIAYTYNEPIIFIETILDSASLAKQEGISNILVTNGYITKEAIDLLKDKIDAMNIDLKSFNDDFYKRNCGAKLAPVLECIKNVYNAKIHIEITTLIIPGENDSDNELRDISRFIASIDKKIPWHISRFSPMHKMLNKSPTPRETLERAYKIGKEEGLNYVHLGNI